MSSGSPRFATLNVFTLSPAPKYVPITENRFEYVILEISFPSHYRYPSGVEPVIFVKIIPTLGSSDGG